MLVQLVQLSNLSNFRIVFSLLKFVGYKSKLTFLLAEIYNLRLIR